MVPRLLNIFKRKRGGGKRGNSIIRVKLIDLYNMNRRTKRQNFFILSKAFLLLPHIYIY
jgi:hypothetical protein